MIYAYGLTQQGAYHIKQNMVCQDSHNIIKFGEDMIVAAVADGLGSEQYSDIASRLAADISTNYCAENIQHSSSDEDILDIIQQSFQQAQWTIEQTCVEQGHEADQYDTTLSLAVLINDSLNYGHSGDSGIVALTTEGLYYKVTTQQRDEDGRVFPLFFGPEKWEFGKFNQSVVSVFLATDGMYEILFPIYIRNEKVNIYVALAQFFMDPQALHIEELGEPTVQAEMDKFVSSISEAQVNDDKTIVVMMNTSIKYTKQFDSYYAEPNWCELKKKYAEAWKRAAYPQLFKDISDVAPIEETDTDTLGGQEETTDEESI